jgi:hypothetical protein
MEDFEKLMREAAASHDRVGQEYDNIDMISAGLAYFARATALADETTRNAQDVARLLESSTIEPYAALPENLYERISASVPRPRMPSRGLGGGDLSRGQRDSYDAKSGRQDQRRIDKLKQAAQGPNGLEIWDLHSVHRYTNTWDETTESHVHVLGRNGQLYLTPLSPDHQKSLRPHASKREIVLPVNRFNTHNAESTAELTALRHTLAFVAIRAIRSQQGRPTSDTPRAIGTARVIPKRRW